MVTGSSRGIGRATAKLFAAEGAHLVITYRERRDLAESAMEEIRQQGATAISVGLNLESRSSIRTAVEAAASHWDRLDVLVNNAVSTGGEGVTQATWQELLRVNTEGPLSVIEATVPLMKKNRWGRIVNVSSALAVDGLPGYSWYTAAKAALHGATRTLSKELGPYGILVNTVMPGFTLTEAQPLFISPRHQERAAANLAIRRVPTPDEIGRTILFLSSSANSIVTGEIIRASGG